MQAEPEGTPSAAALLYLFADQWAPPDRAMTTGTKVPCKEVKVAKKALAAGLFASSFWNLHHHGFVSLDVYEHKRMFMRFTNVVATKLKEGMRPGLEGMVLAAQNPIGGERKSARDTIREIFGYDVSDPHATVIRWVQQETVEGGVMTTAQAGGIVGAFKGTSFEPICEEIAKFQPMGQQVVSRWQAWVGEQGSFAQLLLDECAKAIGSRTESSDD
jgi:hypothetical protein